MLIDMQIIIDENNENVRLDRFLKKNCKNNSLSEIFSAIRKGYVKVNSKKSKQDYRLKISDKIEINYLDFKIEEKKYNKYDESMIFYEDDDYLIINKPKDIAVHKGTNNKKGLAELFNIDFANRIDKKTKGLVIGCKNKKTLRLVTQLIRDNEVAKKYEAICINNGKYKIGDNFRIENIIDGKKSISDYYVKDIINNKIVFIVSLVTGRKHQIRIQLSEIGMPIIGDDKYGRYNKNDELMLKCIYISFLDKEFKI